MGETRQDRQGRIAPPSPVARPLSPMLRLNEIKLPLDHPESAIQEAILKKLEIAAADLQRYTVFKRSYDARKKSNIRLVYIIDVEVRSEKKLLQRFKKDPHVTPAPDLTYRPVAQASGDQGRPVVIGTGPCGMFAGLLLAQMGFRPILLERGKSVRERSVDTFGFWLKKRLNPESNAQFGEGGAGTFSDGKLYSQVRDPNHYGHKVLTELVNAGASPEILYINKPHIGTYRLAQIVRNLRAKITDLGAKCGFNAGSPISRLSRGGCVGLA